MAGKQNKGTKGKSSKVTKQDKSSSRGWFKRRGVRIIAAILIIAIIIGGGVALCFLTADALFFKNNHFILRHLVVNGNGYWQGRDEAIAQMLNLKLGHDNLFTIDLRKKRHILCQQPNIEQASLIRQLPDTLIVNISEAIPRAALFTWRSQWLVNDSGMVMDRATCVNIGRELPIIAGIPRQGIKAGKMLKTLRPALRIIELARCNYPNIELLVLNVRDPKFIDIKLYYKRRAGVYSVKMPRENIAYMMKILRITLQQALKEGEKRRIINLTYRGKVIFSERP